MDETERRRALSTLQSIWDDLVERLKDTVVENEDGLRSQEYSFAYQQLEDRFAPRMMNITHMMGAIHNAGRDRAQPVPCYRVERVEGELEELDTRINDRLAELPGQRLHNVEIVRGNDGWHAFLTLSQAS